MTPWKLYWITRAATLRDLAGTVLGVGWALIGFGMFLLALIGDLGVNSNQAAVVWLFSILKWVTAAVFAALPVYIFTPTLRELAAIIVLPRIAANDDFQKLGTELPKLAREWLDELRPSKKE